MRVFVLLFVLVCVMGMATGLNFNIFRWPSFKRNRGGGSGYRSGGGGGGGGYGGGGGGGYGNKGGGQRKPNPLRSLQRLKNQAFTSLRNLKAPLFDGLSQVLALKGDLFRKAGNIFNKGQKGQKGGGSSSYYRQPPSSYGGGGHGGGGGGGYGGGGGGHGGGGGGGYGGGGGHGGGGGGHGGGHGGGGGGGGYGGGGGGHGGGGGGGGGYGGGGGGGGGHGGGHGGGGGGYSGGGGGGHGGGGGGGGHGFIEVSQKAPSSGYGAPPAPSTSYGAPAPSAPLPPAPAPPSTGYGAPPAPSTGYGAPPTSTGLQAPPATGYSAPSASGPAGRAPTAPGTGYRAPQTGSVGQGTGLRAPQTGSGVLNTGYRAPQAGSGGQGTGFRAPQAGSGGLGTGYRAPQAGSGQTGSLKPPTGYRAPTGTGVSGGIRTVRRPQSSYSSTGQNDFPTGTGTGNSYADQINAPLSAAMAMGHLLNEDEVVQGGQDSTSQWRPVVGAPTVAPPINVRSPALNNGNTQTPATATGVRTDANTETPLFINLDGSTGNGNGNVVEPPSNDLLLVDDAPVTTTDDELYLLSATEDYDDILLVDKGSPDAAAQALSKVVDAALLINDEPKGRALTGSRPQEQLSTVGQELLIGEAVRSNDILVSGEESNLMFSGLMEELQLNTLKALIRRANLEAMLSTEGGFTIFAPSDSAFTLLPRSAVSRLQNDTDRLREVVLFHVVQGEKRLSDFADNDMLSSASPRGRKLRLNVYQHGSDNQVVTVNGARVKRHDMLATNGVIHVIDKVLYPMADLTILDHLTSCETFTGANVAVTGAGLTPVLEQDGPFTIFLPTTEAFAAIDNATVSSFIQNITLLQHVLMFHIVPGAYFSEGLRDGMWLPTLAQEQELQLRVTTDGYSRRLSGVGHSAKVIKHDIIATNGVIHVIDTVLRPELETPICGHF